MSFELFTNLREIDSLTKMRDHLIIQKCEQEDRLSKLNIRRQETEMEANLLHKNLFVMNTELANVEKSIRILSQQKQGLLDHGGYQEKILHYDGEISTLENRGLELLAKLEEIENNIKELKIFKEGLGKTILDIETEVKDEVERVNGEISQLDFRINSLKQELPVNIQALMQKLFSKKMVHGPFTRVEQGSCFFCRYKISRIEESEIDIQKSVKTCQQCSRIFLPYGI